MIAFLIGVIINDSMEFNLLPLTKGYLPIRATPPRWLGIRNVNENTVKVP